MAKIVYNARCGIFGLSEAGIRRYAEIKGLTLYEETKPYGAKVYWTVPENQRVIALEDAQTVYDLDIPRDDKALVQTVEELGEAANGCCANLRIAKVAAGERYRIDEYDGRESVDTIESYNWMIAVD